MNVSISPRSSRLNSRFVNIVLVWFISITVLLGIGMFLRSANSVGAADGDLSVEIFAGYNLVVDSNVLAPSTYAPSVATVSGRFCNTSGAALTDVKGYIGDFSETLSGSTPGIYPKRYVADPGFSTQHPHLVQPTIPGDYYAFQHVGGQIGIKDASRYIGTLAPGECKNQYWHFTYPRRSNPDNTGPEPVWGITNNVNDDLWLNFDIWGSANDGTSVITAAQTWKMTMRNEISAMANKIKPNPDGQWFNTNTNQVSPGSVITSNGILYELGNIRQGFDNDGDSIPDYNAWLQPIGDPNYDPSCFRLIRTSGTLTVSRSSGKPNLIIPFRDQLYFTNLPDDNNGVVGEVFYTFLALNGPCNTGLSPYQEVASGYDNEKFNGDYGTGIPPVVSTAPEVEIDKAGNLTVTPGSPIEYAITVNNSGADDAGLPLYSVPVVMSDSVPAGTTFIGLSTPENTIVLYSDDYGATYTTTNLGAAVTTVQWWMTETLTAGGSVQATMSVDVPLATSAAFIENCAEASFGSAAPFAESCATTLVQGNNSIGDEVWKDENNNGLFDGSEVGIAGVAVSLYYDQNGDGAVDIDDMFLVATTTSITGYYRFDDLPDGNFVVTVSGSDPNLPFGYGNTTPLSHAVSNLGQAGDEAYTAADFGFGPVLQLVKDLSSNNPAYEGQDVVYTIDLINTRTGDGTGQETSCQYYAWADAEDVARSTKSPKIWANPGYAFGADGPDGLYATGIVPPGPVSVAGHNMNADPAFGQITSVEAVFQMYFSAAAINDQVRASLYYPFSAASALTSTVFTSAVMGNFVGEANAGLLVWDVTDVGSWQWSDFDSSSDMSLVATLAKTAGADLIAHLDAFGFRITTDQSCGGADDTIDPLPLTDFYDAEKLEFVSAVPAESTVSTGNAGEYANTGAIDWANLGPLYAGQTKSVTVTFKAKEPAGNLATTITNTAIVTDAKYLSGGPVHEATDYVTTTLQPTASIGDFIWSDSNGDGVQDPGEPGIPNVGITLTANVTITYEGISYAPGVPIYAFTDVNGNYLFEGLLDGTYTVVVDTSTLPGSSFSQTHDPGGASSLNSTAVVVISGADVVSIDGISCSLCELDVDFGYTVPNTIFGTVWEDINGDGIQQVGENGIAGVTVNLSDGSNTTTDANGGYIFTDLPADINYVVTVVPASLPAGGIWDQTDDPDESPPCTVCDDQTDAIDVSTNRNLYGSYDFGYAQRGSSEIGDTVYADWDGDGTQDVGEAGIDGVALTLYKDVDGDGLLDLAVDAMVSSTVTSNGGDYLFSSLSAGDYFVVVNGTTLPAGFNNQSQDPDETGTCSICDGVGTSSVDGTLLGSDYDIDFGYKPVGTASIGDLVWLDADADGLSGSLDTLEAGESGLGSIGVTLWYDINGSGSYTQVMSTSTLLTGTYLFENLPPGSYQVIVDVADADLPTDALGNLFVPSTPARVSYTLAVGETYLDADFGFSSSSIIGDRIFWDANRSGDEDAGESGIAGVVVTLTNASTAVIGGISYAPGAYVVTQTTDSSGNYLFGGLSPAAYTVSVDTSSISGDLMSDPDADGTVCTDSAVTAVCDSQTVVNITSLGQVFLGADFGYLPSGVIGDRVWRDLNGDGIQDAGEPGIGGVVVTVTLGATTYTTTTDFDGLYSFSGLGDGSWNVSFAQPADMAPTPTITDSNGLDSGAGSVGISTVVVIAGGSVSSVGGISCTADCDLNIDSGFVMDGTYSLDGTVFYDALNDGGLYGDDPGDLPFAGITVYLRDGLGQLIGSTTTDADGNYAFGSLITDTYTVTLNPNSPELSGYNLTTPAPGSPSSLLTASLSAATPSLTDLDFGFYSSTQMDFGDLPSSYRATQLADEGARHVTSTLRLGASVTSEGNGQENATANGDSDDPGVSTSGTTWTDGSETLSISVTGGDGCLVGWIDWNGDGDFADASIGGVSELVVNEAVSVASGSVNITTPTSLEYVNAGFLAYPQDLFARFRLFPLNDPLFAAAGLTLTGGCPAGASPSDMLTLVRGAASGGEVEDYMWTDITGPTSISLLRLDGRSSVLSAALLTAIASLMMVTMMFIWSAKKQLKQAANR